MPSELVYLNLIKIGLGLIISTLRKFTNLVASRVAGLTVLVVTPERWGRVDLEACSFLVSVE